MFDLQIEQIISPVQQQRKEENNVMSQDVEWMNVLAFFNY